MSAQLTLGGLASGLPGGNIGVGPSTVSGTKSVPEIINVELEAGVEKKVPLPPEATQWAAFFQFAGTEPGEVKVKTNLNAGDAGLPLQANAFFSSPVFSGVKEVIFKAPVAPKTFQIVII